MHSSPTTPWAAVAAAAGLLLLSVSCGAPPEPIIGALVPESGAAAVYGKLVRAGMDLALQEINAAGGVGGQPLRIIYSDSASDPEVGKKAARKLIEEDHVPLIIGAVSSAVTMAVLEDVSEPAGVPLLSPAASSPNLTGKSSFFVRIYPSDSLQGARMAEFITNDLHLHRIVVFSVIDEYGSGYKRVFIERFRRKKNREVLKVFNFRPDQTDFQKEIAQAAQLKPEGIFLIGYMNTLAPLVKGIRAAGITAPLFCSGSLTPQFSSMAGEAAEGVIYARTSFRVIGNKEKVQPFITAYRSRYGEEPQDEAAYGYDSIKLAAQVLEGGARTAREVHLSLRSPASRYEGVTGNIVFGNEGDVVASPTLYIIHEGAPVSYKEYLAQGGKPPVPAGSPR
ncbi:MAG: ABC transporter substrate-binding protein [Acidobacteriota bacterium]